MNIIVSHLIAIPRLHFMIRNITNLLLLISTSAFLTVCFGDTSYFKTILLGGHLGLMIVWYMMSVLGLIGTSIIIICVQTSLIIILLISQF